MLPNVRENSGEEKSRPGKKKKYKWGGPRVGATNLASLHLRRPHHCLHHHPHLFRHSHRRWCNKSAPLQTSWSTGGCYLSMATAHGWNTREERPGVNKSTGTQHTHATHFSWRLPPCHLPSQTCYGILLLNGWKRTAAGLKRGNPGGGVCRSELVLVTEEDTRQQCSAVQGGKKGEWSCGGHVVYLKLTQMEKTRERTDGSYRRLNHPVSVTEKGLKQIRVEMKRERTWEFIIRVMHFSSSWVTELCLYSKKLKFFLYPFLYSCSGSKRRRSLERQQWAWRAEGRHVVS